MYFPMNGLFCLWNEMTLLWKVNWSETREENNVTKNQNLKKVSHLLNFEILPSSAGQISRDIFVWGTFSYFHYSYNTKFRERSSHTQKKYTCQFQEKQISLLRNTCLNMCCFLWGWPTVKLPAVLFCPMSRGRIPLWRNSIPDPQTKQHNSPFKAMQFWLFWGWQGIKELLSRDTGSYWAIDPYTPGSHITIHFLTFSIFLCFCV